MSHKIILIEDEYFISDLYKRQLELASLAVDTFATGGDGLEAIKANNYELLLLDMMLPDMDGLEILRTVRSDEKVKSLPVMILTNLSQESVISQAKALGVIDYIVKSQITPDQIVQRVLQVLNPPLQP